MSHVSKLILTLLIAATIGWTIGCGSKSADQPSAKPAADEHGDMNADDPAMAATIEAALADLSPADRELAVKQKVCPISGDPLGGAMGAPIKMVVKGHTVFICCESCKDPLQNDPDRYLAKLGLLTDGPPTTE